jgi:hypothetical protein
MVDDAAASLDATQPSTACLHLNLRIEPRDCASRRTGKLEEKPFLDSLPVYRH